MSWRFQDGRARRRRDPPASNGPQGKHFRRKGAGDSTAIFLRGHRLQFKTLAGRSRTKGGLIGSGEGRARGPPWRYHQHLTPPKEGRNDHCRL